MPSNWKADYYLSITLKPKSLFYTLILTMLANTSIWLFIFSQTCQNETESYATNLCLSHWEHPALSVELLFFLFMSVSVSGRHSAYEGQLCLVTNKASLYLLVSKHKHPKAVEGLHLQAETKLNVYNLMYIEFQALETNSISLTITQKLQCITSDTDVTRYLNAFFT